MTHYTGIGTEIRESFTGANAETKVVVNMPNGLGRYGIEDAVEVNANASKNFEWYLKNHLGSTMLVFGTVASTNPNEADVGEKIAAYDYRAFGEMVELTPPPTDKVTENFTGKEHDDEIALDYFGARYLDPMLGMWISVDPARQFASPYLYAGNGMNTVNVVDPDGEAAYQIAVFLTNAEMLKAKTTLDSKKSPDYVIDYRYFLAVQRGGRRVFKNDFAIKIVRNQKEMVDFVKEGRYTAIIGHTWSTFDKKPIMGSLFNRTHSPAQNLNLMALDYALMGSGSSAKVFGCRTGQWNMGFVNIEYGGNKGKLPIDDAFISAIQYLADGYDFDKRMEKFKPVMSEE